MLRISKPQMTARSGSYQEPCCTNRLASSHWNSCDGTVAMEWSLWNGGGHISPSDDRHMLIFVLLTRTDSEFIRCSSNDRRCSGYANRMLSMADTRNPVTGVRSWNVQLKFKSFWIPRKTLWASLLNAWALDWTSAKKLQISERFRTEEECATLQRLPWRS